MSQEESLNSESKQAEWSLIELSINEQNFIDKNRFFSMENIVLTHEPSYRDNKLS